VKPLKDIVAAALMPLLYLNIAGLAAGAVWLGMVSQWHVIWLGVMIIFFSPYIIPLLLMPAGIFSHFMALYQNTGQRRKEQVMFFCSIGYVLLFVTLLCVYIFAYVLFNVRPEAHRAALLWGSSAALTPLLLWSSRDRNNIFIMTTVELAQAAILALCAVRFAGTVLSFWASFAIFGGIMVAGTVAQAIYEKKQMIKPR